MSVSVSVSDIISVKSPETRGPTPGHHRQSLVTAEHVGCVGEAWLHRPLQLDSGNTGVRQVTVELQVLGVPAACSAKVSGTQGYLAQVRWMRGTLVWWYREQVRTANCMVEISTC